MRGVFAFIRCTVSISALVLLYRTHGIEITFFGIWVFVMIEMLIAHVCDSRRESTRATEGAMILYGAVKELRNAVQIMEKNHEPPEDNAAG